MKRRLNFWNSRSDTAMSPEKSRRQRPERGKIRDRESEFKVRDRKGTRWVKFFPLGSERRKIPIYVLDEKKFSQDPQECLAWFR
jgi:hypothetical protein